MQVVDRSFPEFAVFPVAADDPCNRCLVQPDDIPVSAQSVMTVVAGICQELTLLIVVEALGRSMNGNLVSISPRRPVVLMYQLISVIKAKRI